jgi:type VI secretion system protein ImpE
MTSAEQSVREGKLSPALEELQLRVRRNPSSAADRLFLFQLLAALGQWERAAAQLKVAGELDASALISVQMYGPALQCELLRNRVFAGETTPLIMGEPERWMALLVEALKHTAGGRYDEGAQLREQALEAAPAQAGSLNGEPFQWLADADSRLGPCLELIVEAKYYWVPAVQVRSVTFEPPSDLRDLIWAQVAVTWSNGGQVPALMPVRYVSADPGAITDLHRLARQTDWLQQPGETYLGVGQRMLATNTGEYPLLEVREILFDAHG